ncbi:MAG: DUF1868 domain-containing protein [Oscillatoriaceae bacterium SKW80]|nr:DUF1868 domain-containing protein [Oscillatoriaceae bacterium SKYG93]MCX8121132.1 DUF1868 domain-containing protein [Oscillatoriaceae bacterium SKW80]MDW8453538.1 DUF1868 domain-containing protein [Oscillatoriaceae cyanobacterium SKYGB_i_bin93]HIK26889.1 DUF1868 domain-containing protein [Oscillatoriaceae cyanobacterium M7585_C2015_266]
MDDTYQTYLNRVARMTLPESYQSGVQHILPSTKFKLQPDGSWQAAPFPGYSAITPPWEDDPANHTFYNNLQQCQAELLQQLDEGLLVPVPPESFHFTLADLIWDGAYRHASEKPDFDEKLRAQIAESFRQYQSPPAPQPIHWQLLGLMLMPRAIGVCLVPRNEYSYEQLVQFRRLIYQNPGLIALGIEQQYHFSAHITLGYFGEIKPDLDRDRLSSILCKFNDRWLEAEPQEIWVHHAELRKFDDMTRYYRQPDWPILEF